MKATIRSLRSDASLVGAALRQSQGAFEELISRYQVRAEAITLAIGVRPDRLPDVLQEAFILSFQNLAQLRKAESFRPWFLRIVRNAARRSLRDKGLAPLSLELESEGPEPVDEVEMKEVHSELWRAVEVLPEGVREAICLYYYEGESVKAVARTLGISKSAAKVRLHRGRECLRDQMWRKFGEALRGMVPTRNEKRRRARRITLLVMATLPSGVTATAQAGGFSPSSIPASRSGGIKEGFVAMESMKVIALGLAAVVVLVAGVAVSGGDRSPGVKPGGTTIPSGPDQVADAKGARSGPGRATDATSRIQDKVVTPEVPTPRPVHSDSMTKERADKHWVKGRVLDRLGQPFAGAQVLVLGEIDPFERENPIRVADHGPILYGHPVLTREDGSYEARFSGPREVLVMLGISPRFSGSREVLDMLGSSPELHWETSEGQWVKTPADGVDFSVEREATAEVRVTGGPPDAAEALQPGVPFLSALEARTLEQTKLLASKMSWASKIRKEVLGEAPLASKIRITVLGEAITVEGSGLLGVEDVPQLLKSWPEATEADRIRTALALGSSPEAARSMEDTLKRWIAEAGSIDLLNALLVPGVAFDDSVLSVDSLRSTIGQFPEQGEEVAWELLILRVDRPAEMAEDLTQIVATLSNENRSNGVYAAWAVAMREAGSSEAQEAASWFAGLYPSASPRLKNGIIEGLQWLYTVDSVTALMDLYDGEGNPRTRMDLLNAVNNILIWGGIQARQDALYDRALSFFEFVAVSDPDPSNRAAVPQGFQRYLK